MTHFYHWRDISYSLDSFSVTSWVVDELLVIFLSAVSSWTYRMIMALMMMMMMMMMMFTMRVSEWQRGVDSRARCARETVVSVLSRRHTLLLMLLLLCTGNTAIISPYHTQLTKRNRINQSAIAITTTKNQTLYLRNLFYCILFLFIYKWQRTTSATNMSYSTNIKITQLQYKHKSEKK